MPEHLQGACQQKLPKFELPSGVAAGIVSAAVVPIVPGFGKPCIGWLGRRSVTTHRWIFLRAPMETLVCDRSGGLAPVVELGALGHAQGTWICELREQVGGYQRVVVLPTEGPFATGIGRERQRIQSLRIAHGHS